MNARPILLVFLAFFASPSFAVELNDRLDDACFTELSFFCRKLPNHLEPRMRCLRDHSDILTPRCVSGMQSIEEALAKPKVIPAVSTATAVGVGTPTAPAKPAVVAMPLEMETHLTRYDGSVYVHLANQAPNSFIKADKNIPLDKGDMVRTGADGKAELAINAESVIELGPDTDVQIDQLEPKSTDWRILTGSIVAKIHALLQGQEMRFTTSSAVAAIRGTELSVSQSSGGETTIGVLDEGRVIVTSAKGGQPVFLNPHQQTRVAVGKSPMPAVPFAAKPELSKDIEEARTRADQVKKEWKPMGAKARADFRQLLAKRPTLPGEKLPNVHRKPVTLAPSNPAKPAGRPPKPGAKGPAQPQGAGPSGAGPGPQPSGAPQSPRQSPPPKK